jgi:prepilin-type N-terminal cleavage/methylation domain-containing protein
MSSIQRRKSIIAFTIVELIIVIAVIGILAALTVIGIGAWRTRVAQTAVKSDITNLQASMQDARNRTDSYPVFPVGTKFTSGGATSDVFVQSEYVEITYAAGNATYYCVNVQSKTVTSVVMFLNTSGGNTAAQTGTC